MPEHPEQQEFRDRLADLSRRIEARLQEFRDQGEFSDTHQQLLTNIRQHHSRLQAKLDDAARRGVWDLMKAELTLDYNAIVDSMRSWQDRLDTEEVRNHSHPAHETDQDKLPISMAQTKSK